MSSLPIAWLLLLPCGVLAAASSAREPSWVRIDDAGPSRFAQVAVWDTVDHGVLVTGGETHPGTAFRLWSDCWLFTPPGGTGASGWQQLVMTGSGPGDIAYQAGAWDSKRQVLWVFGGVGDDLASHAQLWALDVRARRWSVVQPQGAAPSARLSASLVYWRAADRLVLVGGRASFVADGACSDWWTFDPSTSTWTSRATPAPARWQAVAAIDETHGVLVLQGGLDEHSVATADTFTCTLGEGSWQHGPSGPGPTEAASGGWDEQHQCLLVYGGVQEGAVGRDSLMAFQHGEWMQVSAHGGPGPRAYHALVIDPDQHRLVVLGGVINGFGSTQVDPAAWIGTWPDPTARHRAH